MAQILALLGSPKTDGTNSVLIDELLRGAASCGDVEVQKLVLNKLKIIPCQACDACMHTGRCHLKDDMEIIYESIIKMDAFILGAPIYFSGISAQAKLMIDRCQPFWSEKYVRKNDVFSGRLRPGIFVATGGQAAYEGQFIGSLYVMKLLFKMIGVKGIANLTLDNLDSKPLAQRPDDLAQAFELGRKLMEDCKGGGGIL
ncbi:flavodoxin family protein [Sporomusa sp. GT1]|uniref:flavodoxin family protein n=1 Tax=Sporomusa sp. GT1 TaxID=1534747 RepID=UPI00166F2A77|nr:flavodoxin family protein [Sporomusa sp. GT1]